MYRDEASKKVAVITGSTGTASLAKTIDSVRAQITDPGVVVSHWVVTDGEEYAGDTRQIISKSGANVTNLVLPRNTGGSGYLCHRINGSVPWLVDADYVCFLDQDNSFEPDHVQGLIDAIGDSRQWAHSLRTIVDDEGSTPDNCESIGGLCHTCLGFDDRLVDTNCFMMTTGTAIEVSSKWYVRAREPGQLEGDRAVTKYLLDAHPDHGVSRSHSVSYRASNRGDSVPREFFVNGNRVLGAGVGGYDFARKNDAYLFHFNEPATGQYVLQPKSAKSPVADWCMTMWRGFENDWNLIDGYKNIDRIPRGAVVLVTMCLPDMLPLAALKHLKNDKDASVVLYTAEGPNARHRSQWTRQFLAEYFTHLLTHWTPLLENPLMSTAFAPHNARFLTMPEDSKYLLDNAGKGRSVGMVLERRGNRGMYTVDGTRLQCLDHLRESLARGTRDLTVFGSSWKSVQGVTVGWSEAARQLDPKTPSEHLRDFVFALIIENCDAEGYVSEKFGDSLMAGCVPLYYGTPSAYAVLPEGCYMDIRGCETGAQLQRMIDDLDDDQVFKMRARVLEVRMSYLASVGAKGVYDGFKNLRI